MFFDTLEHALPSLLVRFFIYGLVGWCIEIIFTGVASAVFQKDRALTGKTYLWMHPVWGLTCLAMEMLHQSFATHGLWVRVFLYVVVIYMSEFGFGWLLRKALGRCPWDYSGKGINIQGLIRLDYAPAWMLAALLYEPLRIVVNAFANPRIMELLSQQFLAIR